MHRGVTEGVQQRASYLLLDAEANILQSVPSLCSNMQLPAVQ